MNAKLAGIAEQRDFCQLTRKMISFQQLDCSLGELRRKSRESARDVFFISEDSQQRVLKDLQRTRPSCRRLIQLLPHRLTLSPVSKLSLILSLPVCRRSSLLTGKGDGRGWAWSRIIRQQEGLANQSKEFIIGPPELVQHFRLQGEFPSAQERCMS